MPNRCLEREEGEVARAACHYGKSIEFITFRQGLTEKVPTFEERMKTRARNEDLDVINLRKHRGTVLEGMERPLM